MLRWTVTFHADGRTRFVNTYATYEEAARMTQSLRMYAWIQSTLITRDRCTETAREDCPGFEWEDLEQEWEAIDAAQHPDPDDE